MPNQELINWIKEQKSKGFLDKEIFDYYLQSGGNKDQYDAAMISLQAAVTTEQPVATSAQQPKALGQQPVRKKKNGKKIVLLIFLIFLIIIAGAAFYFINSKNETVNSLIQGFLNKEEVTGLVYNCNVEDNKIKELTRNFDNLSEELKKLKQEKEGLVKKKNDLFLELSLFSKNNNNSRQDININKSDVEYYLDCEDPVERCNLMYKSDAIGIDEVFMGDMYMQMDRDPQGTWRYVNTVNNKFIVIEHTHPIPEGCGQFEELYAINIESKEVKNISLMTNNIECEISEQTKARKTLIKEVLENFKECLANF
jgi:flagellar basal body-associated protein FliL